MYWIIPAAVIAAALGTAAGRLLWKEDKTLEVTNYVIESENIPESFTGFRIAHVSDLQNCQMGRDNKDLLALLEKEQPDIIVITGDLADSRHTHISVALSFAEKAVKIAPVYYVTGNHEARLNIRGKFAKMDEGLKSAGVNVMHNICIDIERGGEKIKLLGIDDEMFFINIDEEIKKIRGEGFNILLAHHPEFFDTYAECKVDLALTGHVHGGQIRLPKIGGLFGPGQGFLPKYDAGLYEKGGTRMILSRGIGNSLFPFRINNRPEVCMVELKNNK